MGIILKPFAWLLVAMYNFFNSYGLALVLFAVVVKLVLFPVTLKSKKSMIKTSMLSGKMQQLKVQYGKNPERYNLEVQKLYEKEQVNPMGGCLWSLIPMFVLIGLYGIIREPLINLMDVPEDMITKVAEITGVANTGSYPQIAMVEALKNPATLEAVKAALVNTGANVFPMNFDFLGLDLAAVPTWKIWQGGISLQSILMFILPIVSAGISYLSMKVTMETNKINKQVEENAQADSMNRSMMITMPLMSLWIGFTVPAGLSVYWITQYLISMVQEVICSKMLKKDYEAAQAAAEEQARIEKEEEKRRKEEARLERARRIEEEKNNKGKKKKSAPKEIEPDQEGVNRDDSRIGIRAYARGRAYIPNRFGGVTPYSDPTALVLEEREKNTFAPFKKKKKSASNEQPAPVMEETIEELEVVEELNETETEALTETVEMEEIEVEVEEVEVENEEGV